MTNINGHLKDLSKLSYTARNTFISQRKKDSYKKEEKECIRTLFEEMGDIQKQTNNHDILNKCYEILDIIDINSHTLSSIQDITNTICEKVLLLQLSVKQAIDKEPKRELNIAIYSGDGDWNDGFGQEVENRLRGNTPIIISKRFLMGSEISCCGACRKSRRSKNETAFLENKNNWDIYQSGEMLVFLPTTLLPEKSGLEKLKALDFASDGSLRPITSKEVFQEPECEIENISPFEIFAVGFPKVDKHVYIAGHGSVHVPAGFDDRIEYRCFLRLLEAQNCKSLTISSCYAGGQSSLLHLPKTKVDSPIQLSFPTIVRSIGDLTTTGQEAEDDLDGYFENLRNFLGGPQPKTYFHFRQMFEQVENGKKVKDACNLVQVYFPSEIGSFRPVGEGNRAYSLTYTRAKKGELPIINEEIIVSNREYLLVHPLVTRAPITCSGKDPTLVSMIPGTGHHFIRSIQLEEKTPHKFIQDAANFYSEKDSDLDDQPNIYKGFSIGELHSKSETLKEVVIFLTKERSQYVYLKENQYYHFDGEKSKPITPFQYARIRFSFLNATSPTEDAIRSSSGGQESKEIFEDAINSDAFWSTDAVDVKKMTVWIMELCYSVDEPTQHILELVNHYTLSPEEKMDIVFMLAEKGEEEAAESIIKAENLDLNRPHKLTGELLISMAISRDMVNLAKTLIDMKVNLNVLDREGRSPLHTALYYCSIITSTLLDQEGLDFKLQDDAGKFRLFDAAIYQPEMVKLLAQRGTNIEQTNKEGLTALGSFAENGMLEQVKILLKLSADPNGGARSPLILSIQANALPVVQELLSAGGRPFETDKSGTLPINEAITMGNVAIVELFLNQEDCSLDVQDKDGLSPMEMALFFGNNTIIQMLKEKNARLPITLTKEAFSTMQHVVKRLDKLEDHETLKDLLIWNNQSIDFKLIVTKYLLNENPEMLSLLIEEGYIHPDTKGINGYSVFRLIMQKALQDFNQYRNLVQICLNQGVDLDHKEGRKRQETALENALREEHSNLVEMLRVSGAAAAKPTDQPVDLIGDLFQGD